MPKRLKATRAVVTRVIVYQFAMNYDGEWAKGISVNALKLAALDDAEESKIEDWEVIVDATQVHVED